MSAYTLGRKTAKINFTIMDLFDRWGKDYYQILRSPVFTFWYPMLQLHT